MPTYRCVLWTQQSVCSERYERVEKADGTPVEIVELLELARKAARDAIAGEFGADNLSTFTTYGRICMARLNKHGTMHALSSRWAATRDIAMEVARRLGIFVRRWI